MKDNMTRATWGALFVLFGIFLAGRAFGAFDFNLFFPGWWTLFIIIPSVLGLMDRNNRTFSIFGLGLGILLLLAMQGQIDWIAFPKLLAALIFMVIGLAFLFRGESRQRNHNKDKYNDTATEQSGSYDQYDGQSYKTYEGQDGQSSYSDSNETGTNETDNADKHYSKDTSYTYGSQADYQENGSTFHEQGSQSGSRYSSYERQSNQGSSHNGDNHFSGFLSSRNVQFIDELFTGAVITSVLGNVQMDLRNAMINDDVVIDATCILGGIDIYVPRNIKISVNCTPILGGVDSKVNPPYNGANYLHTIYIKGTCIMGGIEVK